ncbi:MAG: molybdopterin cofactor-binding domain-containing protein [Micromonosporaceae bacterium]
MQVRDPPPHRERGAQGRRRGGRVSRPPGTHPAARHSDSVPKSLPGSLRATPRIGAWLDFADEGIVTIRAGKVEYGQGVWTALAQVAAEELDVRIDRVRVAPVSTSTSPDEGTTSGSRSIEESGTALRQVCAEARALLLVAAAHQLGESATGLTVDDGRICLPNGATALTYWSLYQPELLDRDATGLIPVKDPGRWSIAGRSAPRRDIPGKVAGRPSFLHDLMLPGMLFGRVIRPPGRSAVLEDVGDVRLPQGVVATVRDGSFLGVVAESDRVAVAAAGMLARAARWSVSESLPDERDLKAFLLSRPAETLIVDEHHDGSAAAAANLTAQTLTAEFTRPFIAHASMAPSCAIGLWDPPGQVTVWAHSQGIFALRAALADGLGLPRSQVVVHHAEGAGAYGHNGADDVALDAVLLARAVAGRPVRVLWSREDEMCWAPLGPAMLARLAAGLDRDGRIVTWRQDVWSNGFIGRPGSGGEPRLLAFTHVAGGKPMAPSPDGPPTGAMGSTRNAVPHYDIPDRVIARHRLLDMPIRTSSLRSLGAFLNVFAIESFMDELAAAAGADPVAFRLTHLSDARARRVIEEVAEMSGWAAARARHPWGEGVGLGLGFARYKGASGYCAAAAEVEADTSVRVRKLWLAVDVGRVINPDGVINQVEGGAVQSASWALRERVRFDRTRITSVSWDTYPILRFTEVPDVNVRVVNAPGERETGAGEVAQGPVAGAIGNAVSHAAGVRVRDLPLTTEQVARAIEQSPEGQRA